MLGRILVFLGGLLVVLLFAALLAPLFVDWTDFRKDFEDQASRIIGKKVVVHGTVDARLLPFPSVTLHDVRVGQESDGTPLVQVSRFSMDAELAPFLSGEALIFDMRIEEPKARIRLLKDGTLDWMRGSQAVIPAKTVVLENVHITDGEIEFIDEQSGRTRHVTGLNAEMSAKSLAGPWRIDGNAALDGEKGGFVLTSSQPEEASAAMRLKTRILPERHPVSVELDGELKLIDRKPNYNGTFAAGFVSKGKATDADAGKTTEPRVTGAFELTNERIRVPEYRLELGAVDDPYVVTGEATLDTGKAPEFLLTADGQQIDVNRIGNQGQKGKTGRDATVSARQRLNALIAIAAEIPVPQVPGRANLKLPAIVVGDTTIRDVRLDVRPAGTGWSIENAVAILPGRTQVEGKGRLTLVGEPSFTGDMLVASTQPSGLASWLSGSVDPVIRQLKTAGFSAAVSLTPELQRFEGLELVVGPSVMKGRMEREALDGKPSSVSLDLNGNTIDLDVLKALAGLFAGDESGAGMLDHKIAAQLKAGKFTAFGVEAENVETVFTASDGALSLERLTIGNIAGASLTAIGRAEGSLADYSGTGRMTFKAFDPGPFLTMLRDHMPHHPVIDRLVRNAAWFADTQLKLTLSLGGDQGKGLAVKLTGTANGSRINLDYKLDDLLDLSGQSGVNVEATLENPVTSVLFGQAGLQPLPFEADDNGLLSLKIAKPDGNVADATLTFTTNRTSFTAGGKLDLTATNFLAGQSKLSLDTADIEPYLIMNGIALPRMGTGTAVKLGADLAIDADTMVLSNLKGTAGGNDISAGLTIDRKATGLKATGDLSVATADLAWLAEAIYGGVSDPVTGLLSDAKLALLPSGSVDVSVKLQAKSFWPDLFGPVRDFAGTLRYKGDELAIEDIAGLWSGGNVSGRALMGNSQGSGFFQSRIDVVDGDTAAISWSTGGAPVVGGRFGLTVATEATGKSLAQMMAGASGSGELRLVETKIRGLGLDVLKPLMSAADLIEGEITPQKIQPIAETLIDNGETALGNIAVPFTITEGRLRAQNVTAGNDLAKLSAEATIDVAEQRLDSSVSIDFAAGDETLAGGQPSLRIGYAGLLAAPGRSVDATDITNFLSLRAFERERRRVEKLQANVLEKQRLRREVALYKFRDGEREAERARAAEQEQVRRAEEVRLRALAVENAERLKAEAAAQAAAAEKAAAEAAAAKAAADKAAAEKAAADRAAAEKAAADKAAVDKAAADKAAAKAAAEKAAAAKAEADRKATEQKGMPVDPSEKVTRGEALPAPGDLNFETLPGAQ